MKRILLADDHPAIRKGTRLIIENRFKDVEFGEASNGNEVFKLVKDQKWDIIIIDMDMPGRNGLEVIALLKDQKSKIPVLMFSMHPEEQVAIRALKAGASGYLTKDASGEAIVNAVEVILSGRKYITPATAEKLAQQLQNPHNKKAYELLSDREYQTLLLFSNGKTVSEIAEELSLSISTISTFRARILEKTGMKTNAELINYAIRNNLV